MQCALHLLTALLAMQALEAFLDARREWLLSALQSDTAPGLDKADAASARLAVIAAQVQVIIYCHLATCARDIWDTRSLSTGTHQGSCLDALVYKRRADDGSGCYWASS